MKELIPRDEYGIFADIHDTARVDSLFVAQAFEKRHDNVLKDIRELDCSDKFRLLNFEESSYHNAQGKKQPAYSMPRDGFVFLAMGYRGKKAAEFKELYIRRFNEMESFIRTLVSARQEFPLLTANIMLASKTSTDGSTWTSWNVLETFDLSASSGTRTAAASTTPGTYTKYGLWTIDTLDVYSSEQVSNSIFCVAAACDEPIIAAPKAGASTYNPNPRVLLTTGTQPDEQVAQVKIGTGDWQDGVNNPSLFSPSGAVGGSAAVMFKAETQSAGAKTLTVRCVNTDFEAPSAEISRSLTVLASPFEAITANETKVKASHITAFRTAVNTVRNCYGLAQVSWSEEITAGRTEVKNWPLHILEIRAAVEPVIALINQFGGGTGFTVPEPDWEELGTGRPRAAVMNQLAELILSL